MHFLLVVWLFILVKCSTIDLNDNFTQLVENALRQEEEKDINHEDNILYRKRRYLLFPEGTSFQIVWDGIIGVVDYTNYLILGITVAMAWELPSKAPSELYADLQQALNDGTLGFGRRNDTVTDYTANTSKESTLVQKFQSQRYQKLPNFKKQYRHFSRPLDYVPKSRDWRYRDFTNYDKWHKPSYRNKSFLFSIKPKWWNFSTSKFFNNANKKSRLLPRGRSLLIHDNKHQRQPSQREMLGQTMYNAIASPYHISGDQQSTKITAATKPPGRKHYIYPVFGKRSHIYEPMQYTKDVLLSANNHSTRGTQHQRHKRSGIVGYGLNKMDCINIRHHRATRQQLYQKIEKYLDKRGSHGHHCLLRALCETGQKSNEQDPGSFMAELMRTIFTIPEAVDADGDNNGAVDKRILRYDRANAFQGNCATRYQMCKDSLWTSDFLV